MMMPVGNVVREDIIKDWLCKDAARSPFNTK